MSLLCHAFGHKYYEYESISKKHYTVIGTILVCSRCADRKEFDGIERVGNRPMKGKK